MFTGIVQGQAKVVDIKGDDKHKTFTFEFPKESLLKLQTGASIAINGTCLTVTRFSLELNQASFDAIQETLTLTNLQDLNVNSLVNYERAATVGDEIGGHIMSGHIQGTCKVTRLEKTPENCTIFFSYPPKFQKYLLPKGFVGINGCSLTLGETIDSEFCVHLIPETLKVTGFGECKVGVMFNLEIDNQTQTIVDTVERVLSIKKT